MEKAYPTDSLVDNAQIMVSISDRIGISNEESTEHIKTEQNVTKWLSDFSIDFDALNTFTQLFKSSNLRFHTDHALELSHAYLQTKHIQLIAKHSGRLNDELKLPIYKIGNETYQLLAGTQEKPTIPALQSRYDAYLSAARVLYRFGKLEPQDGRTRRLFVLSESLEPDINTLAALPEHKMSKIYFNKTLNGFHKTSGDKLEEMTSGAANLLVQKAVDVQTQLVLRTISLVKLHLAGLSLEDRKFAQKHKLHNFLSNMDKTIERAFENKPDPGELTNTLSNQLVQLSEKLHVAYNKEPSNEVLDVCLRTIMETFNNHLKPMQTNMMNFIDEISPEKTTDSGFPSVQQESSSVLDTAPVLQSDEQSNETIESDTTEIDHQTDILKTEARQIVNEQVASMQTWRLSNKTLRNLNLMDAVYDITHGTNNREGVLRDKATEYMSTIVVLYDNYMKHGLDGARHVLAENIGSEETREELLHEIHSQYKQLTSVNSFPKITDSLGENVGWIIENWDDLQDTLDKCIGAAGFSDALSKTLDLTLVQNEDIDTESVNPNALTAEELAELAQLEAEEERLRQADEEEFTRLVEEDAQRRAAEEAQILAELEAEAQTDPEITEAEVKSIGDIAINLANEELIDIADELEFEVFPRGSSLEELKIKARHFNPDMTTTDWGRIEDLKRIADAAKGELYISRQTLNSGKTPYYVAVFNLANETIAVAENPVEGNATYIIRESLTPGNWQEVLRLPKRVARQVGAAQTVHRNGKDHVKKIMDRIQRLLTVKQYETSSK